VSAPEALLVRAWIEPEDVRDVRPRELPVQLLVLGGEAVVVAADVEGDVRRPGSSRLRCTRT
jgi:hypothetical protein